MEEPLTSLAVRGLADLEQVAHREHVPLHVTFEITQRCNVRCQHCYNFDRRSLPQLGDELGDAEIARVIDEVHAAGCLFFTLSGGEALVHPSCVAFVRQARALGMFVRLKSNGTLLERHADALAAADLTAVDVSLHGATAATHDAFVDMPGAFERLRRGVAAMRAAGVAVQINTSVVRDNAHEVGALVEWARAEGLGLQIDANITARHDGDCGSTALRVDRATLAALYRGALRPLLSDEPADLSQPPQCGCARSVAGISAAGIVYPCIGAPLPAGDLRRQRFGDIWRDSPTFARIRGLGLDDFAACKGCSRRAHCRRSSGAMLVSTGDYTGPRAYGADWACLEADVLTELFAEEEAARGRSRLPTG